MSTLGMSFRPCLFDFSCNLKLKDELVVDHNNNNIVSLHDSFLSESLVAGATVLNTVTQHYHPILLDILAMQDEFDMPAGLACFPEDELLPCRMLASAVGCFWVGELVVSLIISLLWRTTVGWANLGSTKFILPVTLSILSLV